MHVRPRALRLLRGRDAAVEARLNRPQQEERRVYTDENAELIFEEHSEAGTRRSHMTGWMKTLGLLAVVAAIGFAILGANPAAQTQGSEWKYWGSDINQTHFSPLTQITPANE